MTEDKDFSARRDEAKQRINRIDRETLLECPRRDDFFQSVYDGAEGDAARVPWADLAPKPHVLRWLGDQAQHSGKAMDVGCGLGDNAEALSAHGLDTTAFDFSSSAIEWARKRFPTSAVDYHVADLFNLPARWQGAFDLVNECYTLQSIPPETLDASIPAIAGLVAPGGVLLVYTRTRQPGSPVEGPPWPLEEHRALSFKDHGLELVSNQPFENRREDRSIPHYFSVWRRPG